MNFFRNLSLLLVILLLAFFVHAAAQGNLPAPRNAQSETKRWADRQLKPEEYVASKFRDHDVVFLGEMHSVRENLEFLQRLIPRLHAVGIDNLVYEFASYRDQPKIDALLNAEIYDESQVLEVLWHCCDLKWVTQEYADVFKRAWELNHSLPKGERRFRIIGAARTDIEADGTPLSRGTSTNGLRDGQNLLNHFDADNFFWAQVIENEILVHKERALVYSGVGHAHTRLYNKREDYGFTVGNFIFDAIGNRAFTVLIHGSAADDRVQVTKAADKFFAGLPVMSRYIGFDTAGSPVSHFPVKQTGYLFDTGKSSDFVLSDVADGYVYLAPLDEWHCVTFRDDFVTQENYKRVELLWRTEHPRDQPYSIDDLRTSARTLVRNQFLYQQGRLLSH